MREIGTIGDEKQARAFADYLTSLKISNKLAPKPGGPVTVWVHREEAVDEAKTQLEEFLRNPSDPRYLGASKVAKIVRQEEERAQRLHLKNTIDMRDRWDYRDPKRFPLTVTLIALSLVATIASRFGDVRTQVCRALLISPLEIVSTSVRVEDEEDPAQIRAVRGQIVGRDPLIVAREGQPWRLLTPIFLHFTVMHLVFNLSFLLNIGSMVEMRKGTLRLLAIVLITGLAGNLGQYYYTHYPIFGGMSGVLYGLFGYVWVRTRSDEGSGMFMPQSTVNWLLAWLVLCMTGILGPIANAAHLVGLMSGMLLGALPLLLRSVRP